MNIIKKPSWLYITGKDNATTIGATIYMPEWYYDPVRSQIEKDALLLHEQKHVEQFQKGGWIRHSWKYTVDRAYRKQCELEAYEAQIQYLTGHGYDIIPERWARIMEESVGSGKWIGFGEALDYVKEWSGR